MAFMEEITRYKEKIMELLWRNSDIKNIIREVMNLPSLSYAQFRKYVKRYGKHPDRIQEEGVYLFFEVDPTSIQNSTISRYTIYFWIFVNDDIVETPKGEVLTDTIASIIDKVINGSSNFGIGPLELVSAPTSNTITGWCCRQLTYKTPDFNRRR